MKSSSTMTFGTSTFLVAVGAVLRYAVSVKGDGFDIHMIGSILMIAGIAGALLSIVLLTATRNNVAVVTKSDATVVETERLQ